MPERNRPVKDREGFRAAEAQYGDGARPRCRRWSGDGIFIAGKIHISCFDDAKLLFILYICQNEHAPMVHFVKIPVTMPAPVDAQGVCFFLCETGGHLILV